MSVKNKPNELYISRVYNAPLKTVWEAWTDPKQVAKWWGPRGFTLTTHSKDLRAGGHWNYTMHGPDGTDYENRTVYHEVVQHERLVYDHGANETQPPLFRVTVEFSEAKGKTKMEMTMTLATAEAAAETKKFVKKAGGNSTWDRLAEYLAKETEGRERFIINRSFETDIGTMFEMWTNPKHFATWLAPAGMTMEFVNADIKPGGKISYSMSGGGFKMYGSAQYQKIEKPNCIVYTQQFNDEKGNVSRHPGSPHWPETMLTVVTFAQEGPKQTRVTVEWEPVGNFTAEELAVFIKERAGMTQGWTGSFDKLDAVLAEQ